jgi:molybdate transport system substrate-binding protein
VKRRVRAAAAAVALLVPVAAGGCGGSSSGGSGGSGAGQSRTITVFAAASLTDAFTAVATAYTQQTHARVTFSFAGSQELVAQVRHGAPADVVATADEKSMALLPGHADAKVFARNRLVIVTARRNPKHIHNAADLARRGVVVVLAAPNVPAGRYAVQALTAAHVRVRARSLEDNVRAVLTKVELGEADAGLVYASDAKAAGAKVATVALPTSPVAVYPVLALTPAGDAFVTFLLSTTAQAILRSNGFLPPP